MQIYTHLSALLSLVVLFSICRAEFYKKYAVFFVYFIVVLAGGIFFAYIGPWCGLSYEMSGYYSLYWFSDSMEHVLKIMVAVSFYWELLKSFPNIRRMIDAVFYGILALLFGLFISQYDPASSLLYTISIYFGRWVFLLMAVVCTFILAARRIAGIRLDPAYFYLVLGFLFYSLTQTLNFFYLAVAYEKLSGFWAWFYQVNYLVPLLLWLRAGLVREQAPAAEAVPAVGLQGELLRRMRRLDTASGEVFQRLNPFRSPR
jgi:hypothetical protein